MYKFVEDLNEKKYDDFVKKYSMASFMEEYNWSKVKDTWGNIHCGLYKNNKLVGVCTILIKKVYGKINLFYIPRGILIDYENYDDLNEFIKNIRRLAKSNNAYVVKMDPNYCTNEYYIKDSNMEIVKNYSKNFENKNNNLIKCGFKFKGIQKDITKSFQPQYNIFAPTINSNGEFLNRDDIYQLYLSSFKRYLNSYHEKRGITFSYTQDLNKVDDLVSLLKETELKQNISLRNKEYFQKLMTSYPNSAYIFFAEINFEKYLKYLEEINNIEEMEKVKQIIKSGEKVRKLSAALVLLPKNEVGVRTSEYLYAGNSRTFTNLHASAGLVYEIIKFSRDHKCQYCNLGGVEGTLDDHLTDFKKKFDGIVMEFTGEYDMPTSFLYYPVSIFYQPLLKIYKLIVKLRRK